MSLEGDGVQVYTGNKEKLMNALRSNGGMSVKRPVNNMFLFQELS